MTLEKDERARWALQHENGQIKVYWWPTSRFKTGRLPVSRNRTARAILLHSILLPIMVPALVQGQSSPAL